MQDRYAGDVGDFGKLGLLRHLCGVTASDNHPYLKPGIIWHRVPDENHNADGRHICYLQRNRTNDIRFRSCDEILYDALAKIVFEDRNRSIAALEGAGLLPEALYCRDDVCYGKQKTTCPRTDWFASASQTTADSDLVFLDPDNGIECTNLLRTERRSRKYVFRDEIRALAERTQRPAVVIYHHLDRSPGTARQRTEQQLRTLQKSFPGNMPFGVLYHRGTTRAFLVLPTPEHRPTLLNRAEELVCKWNSACGKRKPQHFTGPILI